MAGLENEINFGLKPPVQINYEYCKGCGAQGLSCWKPHRFFTFEGYVSALLAFYPAENTPGKVLAMAQEAEDAFPGGFEHGEIGKCVVCGRPDCARPHRKYTREGYAKYQIEIMGIERSEAMKRANEEFRVFGGDWAWYPMNREGRFAPPMAEGAGNVRAPPAPPEGWTKVNDDRYVRIRHAIRAAWKAESAGKSELELLQLRDDFDQRWCNMSGKQEPRFKMPWDYLPRPEENDGGDGSRAQYTGFAGGFHGGGFGDGPQPGHIGGHPGHSGAGTQATFDFQAFAAAYGNIPGMVGLNVPGMEGINIPGMPNIFVSGSGGAGFTFHHHQGGQSQSYEFPVVCSAPQQQHNQNQNQNQELPSRSNAPRPSKEQRKGAGEQPKPPNPSDHHFNKAVKFYAETFIEKTKEKSLETARIWKETLRKKFREEWGPWARDMNMAWDEVPGIEDYGKPTTGHGAGDDRKGGAEYGFDEGFNKWKKSQGGSSPIGGGNYSFDDGFEKWKKSQGGGRGDDDYKKSSRSRGGTSSAYNFDEGFENWKKCGGKTDSSFEEGFAKWKSQPHEDNPDNPFHRRFPQGKATEPAEADRRGNKIPYRF